MTAFMSSALGDQSLNMLGLSFRNLHLLLMYFQPVTTPTRAQGDKSFRSILVGKVKLLCLSLLSSVKGCPWFWWRVCARATHLHCGLRSSQVFYLCPREIFCNTMT